MNHRFYNGYEYSDGGHGSREMENWSLSFSIVNFKYVYDIYIN